MTSLARLRCKHTSATWYRWTGDDWEVVGHLSGPPLVGLTGTLFQRVVCDCGEWLPLGPANDEGEAVAIEKRAAELARLADEHPRLWKRNHAPAKSDVGAGWWVHQMGCVTSDVVTHLPGAQAGYLARCIVTHGED